MKYIRWMVEQLKGILGRLFPRKEQETPAVEEKQPEVRDLVKELVYADEEEIRRKIKSGDIIDAVTAVPVQQLAEMTEEHRHRPYIVVKADEEGVIAYGGSSQKKHAGKKVVFRLSCEEYAVWKDGYIHLNRAVRIPYGQIIGILDTLKPTGILEINGRLIMTKSTHLPLIAAHHAVRPGMIVKRSRRFFYVYQEEGNTVVVYELHKDTRKILVQMTGEIRWLDTEETPLKLDRRELIPVEFCGTSLGRTIKRMQKKKPKKPKAPKQENFAKDHWFRYSSGQIMECGGDSLIYLFSCGDHDYGVEGDRESYKPVLYQLHNLQYYRQTGILDHADLQVLAEDLAECRWMVQGMDEGTLSLSV